jgi:hypothetical protein
MATTSQIEVPITLRLSAQARSKLVQRAAAAGQELGPYVATLVESLVETPRTLEEISGPVFQRFLESGVSDEELSDELERAKHEMRAERHLRHGLP